MLSPDQKAKYEQIRMTALSELEHIDREIESELALVKKKLLELQDDKKSVKQILDGASTRLGMSSVVVVKDLNLTDLNRHAELAKA